MGSRSGSGSSRHAMHCSSQTARVSSSLPLHCMHGLVRSPPLFSCPRVFDVRTWSKLIESQRMHALLFISIPAIWLRSAVQYVIGFLFAHVTCYLSDYIFIIHPNSTILATHAGGALNWKKIPEPGSPTRMHTCSWTNQAGRPVLLCLVGWQSDSIATRSLARSLTGL